jgi:cytochrome c oxidase subunit 3
MFFAFFWAFFHSSFNPSVTIGAVWPPAYLTILDPWKVPLLNTVILLSSGASVTWAHHSIVYGSKNECNYCFVHNNNFSSDFYRITSF